MVKSIADSTVTIAFAPNLIAGTSDAGGLFPVANNGVSSDFPPRLSVYLRVLCTFVLRSAAVGMLLTATTIYAQGTIGISDAEMSASVEAGAYDSAAGGTPVTNSDSYFYPWTTTYIPKSLVRGAVHGFAYSVSRTHNHVKLIPSTNSQSYDVYAKNMGKPRITSPAPPAPAPVACYGAQNSGSYIEVDIYPTAAVWTFTGTVPSVVLNPKQNLGTTVRVYFQTPAQDGEYVFTYLGNDTWRLTGYLNGASLGQNTMSSAVLQGTAISFAGTTGGGPGTDFSYAQVEVWGDQDVADSHPDWQLSGSYPYSDISTRATFEALP